MLCYGAASAVSLVTGAGSGIGQLPGRRPRQAGYAASKGGGLLLGRALAIDWAPHGIYVNVVGPGVTATARNAAFLAHPTQYEPLLARIPCTGPATPPEVAAVVAFLASEAAGCMTGAHARRWRLAASG